MNPSFSRPWMLLLVGALLAPLPARAQTVPPLINYQGRVVVGSTNFNGSGAFKFALVNAAGDTTYWSNDGTSAAGNEPTAAVALPVTGGLYSVALGDPSLANMAALPASVFAGNADVRLRVWFNDGANGSQRLIPDQRLTSVGYAQMAATVPDGAITAAKIGAGAVGAGNLASGTAGTYQAVSGATAAQGNTSYAATGANLVNFTLPATASVGDVVTISGAGAGGYSLTTSAGQSVSTAGGPVNFDTWTPRDSSRSWLAVASSADGAKLVAAVNDGQLFTSTDGGASWTPRDSSRSWYAVASSADGAKLLAAAGGGWLYTSTDSGVSWTTRLTDTNRSWQAVASSANGAKLVAAAYGGKLYTSTNSGVSWTARLTDANRNWYSLASSADGAKLVAAVKGGQLYTSTDSGVSWTARESSRNWNAVASSADGVKLVAAVNGGRLFISSDSGVSWTPSESNRYWCAVASSADGTRWIAAEYGGLLYTSADGGVSWTPRESSRNWLTVASSADGTRLVAGEFDGPLYTNVNGFTGAQGSTAQVQYLGNGQWSTLNQSQLAAGSVGNAQLVYSSVTIKAGSGLTGGGVAPLGGSVTLSANASIVNSPNALVVRDANGNFSAGTITANLSGNAATANTATSATTATNATTATSANSFTGPLLGLPATSSANSGVLTLGGASFLQAYGTNNAFVGKSAGNFTTSGGYNSALGALALNALTTGATNAALGNQTLSANTTGNSNTASGDEALNLNITGSSNTANGHLALYRNTTGNNNVALGESAGFYLTTGSNNVDIANTGGAGESNTIRIGTQGTQTAAYLAGVYGSAGVSGVAVYVNGNGQLGPLTSSARYKQDIRSMDRRSEAILALRPVTYEYNPEVDPAAAPQFGLIAEEVEKVCPDLVAHAGDGTPYTVRYEAVNAMLLNEFLKQHRRAQQVETDLREQNAALRERLNDLEARDQARDARLTALEQMPPVAAGTPASKTPPASEAAGSQ